MIKILDNKFPSVEWNKVAQHPLQSWEWGEVRQKTGIDIVRIGVFHKEKIVDVFLLTLHAIPHTHYKIAYIPRSIWPTEDVLNFLKNWAKQQKVVFIKFEPYVEKSLVSIPKSSSLTKSSHQLFPDWTIISDLTASPEQILKDMKPKTRYNIRLAEKKGVTIKEIRGEEAFEVFAKLYFATTKRQRYYGHDRNYHKIVWDNLKGTISHILVAYYQDKPLAAYELFIFNKRAYYPYGGSSLEMKNIMAPNLLMWEAIKFAQKHGAQFFDMWGSSSPDIKSNDPYAGFTRFKEGYGGKFVQFVGSYDLVIYPYHYAIYNTLYRLRSIYLSLSSPG